MSILFWPLTALVILAGIIQHGWQKLTGAPLRHLRVSERRAGHKSDRRSQGRHQERECQRTVAGPFDRPPPVDDECTATADIAALTCARPLSEFVSMRRVD
jgi:hypothetical protein